MNGGKCVGVGDSASPVGTGSVTRVFRYTAMPTEVCIRDAVTGIEVDVDEPSHWPEQRPGLDVGPRRERALLWPDLQPLGRP